MSRREKSPDLSKSHPMQLNKPTSILSAKMRMAQEPDRKRDDKMKQDGIKTTSGQEKVERVFVGSAQLRRSHRHPRPGQLTRRYEACPGFALSTVRPYGLIGLRERDCFSRQTPQHHIYRVRTSQADRSTFIIITKSILHHHAVEFASNSIQFLLRLLLGLLRCVRVVNRPVFISKTDTSRQPTAVHTFKFSPLSSPVEMSFRA